MKENQDTILVVEDNEDDVFALKWALKKADIANPIKVVMDGKQAVEYLTNVANCVDDGSTPIPCMVFLDLKLPYIGGLEILEWIRAQPSLEKLAVVILSGSDEAKDHERTRALNASFYLVKPAMPADVRRVLEALPDSPWSECDLT